MVEAKKSLGQHWLTDEVTLQTIVDSSGVTKNDTVLEIGPGQGTLTAKLLETGANLIAIELDSKLAANLEKNILHHNPQIARTVLAKRLMIVEEDILEFDLARIVPGYKVVANIPYYLTSKLLRKLSESTNPPETITLLVQKEVAERICAGPGQMSLLAVSVQLYYESKLGQKVAASLFTPPPKVDSQLVMLERRQTPLFENLDSPKFFRIVRAGFSERRKKLRSSLSGGLQIPKEQADELLRRSGINPGARAQELSLEQWHNLYSAFEK